MKICYDQDLVPERPISANQGFKILFHFRIYLPMHCLEKHSVLSSLNLEVKTPQYFVSSRDPFLDKKTLLKIRVNPGLNLTMFRGTGPGLRCHRSCQSNEMTPLPILLAAVFLSTGNLSSKIVRGSFFLQYLLQSMSVKFKQSL